MHSFLRLFFFALLLAASVTVFAAQSSFQKNGPSPVLPLGLRPHNLVAQPRHLGRRSLPREPAIVTTDEELQCLKRQLGNRHLAHTLFRNGKRGHVFRLQKKGDQFSQWRTGDPVRRARMIGTQQRLYDRYWIAVHTIAGRTCQYRRSRPVSTSLAEPQQKVQGSPRTRPHRPEGQGNDPNVGSM